ncbi:non-motile and phage-resistance protein [Abditibacteriota bacterium]|nr:non-motile and phage-resistance protein [Abditibacteriota bacterium]
MRFRLLLFLALCLALGNGAIAYINIQRLSHNERLVSHTNEVLFELERVASLIKDAETGARGYALTGQGPFLEPYFAAEKKLEKHLEPLNTLVLDNPLQHNRVPGLEKAIRTRLAHSKEVIEIRDSQGQGAAAAFVGRGEGKRDMDAIRAILGTMSAEEIRLRMSRNIESANSLRLTKLASVVATLATMILIGGVGGLVLRSTRQNIELERQRDELTQQKTEIQTAKHEVELQSSRLADALAKLQRAEEMRDSLTAMLVHDLRTPLTTLIGPLEMLKDGMLGHLDETQEEIISMSLGSGQRLLGLVNELLDVSKMEAGQMQIRAEQMRPEEVIQKAVETVSLSQYGGGAPISMEVGPNIPFLQADPELITRVLINLLGNAIKFTPTSGRIVVGAHLDPDDSQRAQLFVRDSGEGIPPEDIDKVFDKFGQVETRRAGRKMSTGLGLTFCKLAVEAHGGQIWVESKLGEGSAFFFTLAVRPINGA